MSHQISANTAPAVLSPGSGCRLTWLREAPPVSFRPTPEAVYLVGTAAFPVGDDELSIKVVVEEGADLVVRSAASAVAWAATGSSLEVDATVEPGGSLDWQLQPLIASKKCRFSQRSRVNLSGDATLRWADEVVLGRSGEEPGWLDLRLDVIVDGRPLLRHQLELGPGVPAWDGPAVLGRNRAVGIVVVAGNWPARFGPRRSHSIAGDSWAVMPLEGPGLLVSAVGHDLVSMRRVMAEGLNELSVPA